MNRHLIFTLLAAAFLAVSCQCNKTVIEGTVQEVDSYGGLQPSFTPKDLEAAGVEYGDLLLLCIGDGIEVEAPYVDAYTESGSMSPCLCNYNRNDKEITASMSNGSFALHVGGAEGDAFVIKMKKKGGYLREYELLQGAYTFDRADYSSDEVFANFRELKATGLKPGVLYRATSPISFKNNKVRFSYTAALCKSNGIKTIVDIADTEEKVKGFLAAEESKGSYMQECYANGNIIAVGSHSDYIDTLFMHKLAGAFRAMLTKPAPYLIHCNEGKDRTGFYCLLLEALCGGTVEEIKTDYMQTFENLYHQQRGTEQYELTWKKNGFRMLYQIANPELWADVVFINWDKASIDGVNIAKAANDYLLASGLSQDEINALKGIIAVE